MSGTELRGNDYATLARHMADKVPSTLDAASDATVASAYATLALAHEQHTANLIALATATYPNGSGMFAGVSEEVRAEILRRLGLNQ